MDWFEFPEMEREQLRDLRKGIDDGVLLLIAKNDRSLRLEVGYGLEGALPDAKAKRIIAEIITPHFKQGHFADGIDDFLISCQIAAAHACQAKGFGQGAEHYQVRIFFD